MGTPEEVSGLSNLLDQRAVQVIEELRDLTYAVHTNSLIAYLATLQAGTGRSETCHKLRDQIEERLGITRPAVVPSALDLVREAQR